MSKAIHSLMNDVYKFIIVQLNNETKIYAWNGLSVLIKKLTT